MISEDVFNQLKLHEFEQISNDLKNGDLILCSGNSVMSSMIKELTGSPFSHVGLLLRLEEADKWLVLESIESVGVRCVTICDGYLIDYQNTKKPYDGKIVIARHSKMTYEIDRIKKLYEKAFELVGDKYSTADIFRIATRISLNKIGIHDSEIINERDKYICSEFVYYCFKHAGIIINYNQLGFISPGDIARHPDIEAIYNLKV